MTQKRLIMITFLFACTIRMNAQFAPGTRMFGPTLGVNYSNQKGTDYDPDDLFEVKESKQFIQQYNINLQYGYFKKENVMISFGLNYSYQQNKTEITITDTNDYNYSLTNNVSHTFGVHGNIYYYFPVKTRYGFYHTERINLSYAYLASNSANQDKTSLETVINVPSNGITTSISVSAGAYYKITEHFLLQTELRIFSLNTGYSWTHGIDNLNRHVDNTSFGISSSGTLAPNATLADLSIGIRYIIPAKK